MWGGFGVPELIILGFLGLPLCGAVLFATTLARRARRFGYPGVRPYLRAVPASDDEKRDAADLTMKGLAFCALGVLFSPLVLIGIVPLFYGVRKFLYASMGLGLIDDADHSGA